MFERLKYVPQIKERQSFALKLPESVYKSVQIRELAGVVGLRACCAGSPAESCTQAHRFVHGRALPLHRSGEILKRPAAVISIGCMMSSYSYRTSTLAIAASCDAATPRPNRPHYRYAYHLKDRFSRLRQPA